MERTLQESPSVSVVMPTFDRPHFLDRAVRSVRAQTVHAWELLVVDDNPPESDARTETRRLLQRYHDDPRIRYLEHDRNLGGSAARNTGIAHARADLVAFLDDDDEWLPTKLERQLERLGRAGDDLGLVFAGYRRVLPDGSVGPDEIAPPDAADLERLLEENRIGTTSSIVCRRAALDAIGGFDAALPASQDYDLYVRMATRYRLEGIREVLLLSHRHGQGSISKTPEHRRRAFTLFYAKHRPLFEAHPGAHARHLRWMGERLLRLGFVPEAKERLSAALALRPFDLRARGLRLLCEVGSPGLEGLWRVRRLARTVLKRVRS